MNAPSPRSWRDRYRARAHERFARAVESSADSGNGGPGDPKLAGELAVVRMLRRSAPEAATMSPAARAAGRAKALAAVAGQRSRPSPHPRIRTTAGPRGRLLVALAAVFCLIMTLSGMAMLASENALPGDPLYGVRRTVESATLGLTSGELAQGNKHLEFAADRVADLETLVAKHPDPANSPVGDYLTGFADFTADATAGARDLDDYGAANSPNVLAGLRDWSGDQSDRITALTVSLPGQATPAASHGLALLTRIQQRAAGLLARTVCYTVTSGAGDDLGPLPATGPCDRRPGTTTAPGASTDGSSPERSGQHPGYTGPTGSLTTTGESGAGGASEAPGTFAPGSVLAPTSPDLSEPPTTTTPPGLLQLPPISLPPLLPGA